MKQKTYQSISKIKTQKASWLNYIYWIASIAMILSIVFNWRAVTSMSILLLLVTSTLHAIVTKGSRVEPDPPMMIFSLAALLYILYYAFTGLFAGESVFEAPYLLKWSVPALPLALWLSGFFNRRTAMLLVPLFAGSLVLLMGFCFFYQLGNNSEAASFFYHDLLSPIDGHAVYHSIYVFTALVMLMEGIRQRRMALPKVATTILVLLLLAFLIFLSSRFIITLFGLYLIFFVFQYFKYHPKRKQLGFLMILLALANAVLIFSTDNPVKKRFSDLGGSLDKVNAEQNNPADYFDGFQFRLLQWKLVPEILAEKDAWFLGMGLPRAQDALNEKYRGRNMYLGADGKSGYAVFNAHNQFLQELLQGGVVALACFLFLCFGLVKMMLASRSASVVFVLAAVLVYALLESLLETQYGVVILCFIPGWVYLSNRR